MPVEQCSGQKIPITVDQGRGWSYLPLRFWSPSLSLESKATTLQELQLESTRDYVVNIQAQLRGYEFGRPGRATAAGLPSTSHQATPVAENIYHLDTMCTAAAFKSFTCPHKWLTITVPCGPGVGFDTCAHHAFSGQTSIFGGPKFIPAPAHSCPMCDKKDHYDGNRTRMVLRGQDMFGSQWHCGGNRGRGPYYRDGDACQSGYGAASPAGPPIICCTVM